MSSSSLGHRSLRMFTHERAVVLDLSSKSSSVTTALVHRAGAHLAEDFFFHVGEAALGLSPLSCRSSNSPRVEGDDDLWWPFRV